MRVNTGEKPILIRIEGNRAPTKLEKEANREMAQVWPKSDVIA
jgi:hypothetical protein